MKKISILLLMLSATPLLVWCSLFGKKMTFQDAYNSLFVSEGIVKMLERLDENAPYWQKSNFTLDGSYNDMLSVATRFDTVGNYDITNNIADVDLAFTLKLNADKSIMSPFWWWDSNSMYNDRNDDTDYQIDRTEYIQTNWINDRKDLSEEAKMKWLLTQPKELTEDEEQSINSQPILPQDSFSPKTNPAAELYPESGTKESKINIDVSFSGKIQLNNSGIYAYLENALTEMMPNDIYDTKSLTKAINTVANQWIYLLPIGESVEQWSNDPAFMNISTMLGSGKSVWKDIRDKLINLLLAYQNTIKTYPLLEETEKTKIDGNVAYWIAWSQAGVSWFVNELIPNLDSSLLEALLSNFSSSDEISAEQLKNQPFISSIISSVILKTPISWYIIIHDKNLVELRINSLQIWEMNLKTSVYSDGTATFETTFSDWVAMTWDIRKIDGVIQLTMNLLEPNMSLAIHLKDDGKWMSLAFSGMWAKVQIGFENEMKKLDNYQPVSIAESKPIADIMATIEKALGNMTGDDVFINRQTQINKRVLNAEKKNSLYQLAQWLWIYWQDNGAYPNLNDPSFSVESLENILVPSYFAKIPKDTSLFHWLHFGWEMKTWYIYIPILSDWKPNQWFMLITSIQPVEYDASSANWVDVNNQLVKLPDPTKLESNKLAKLICPKITITDMTEDSLSKCTAKKDSTALRYVELFTKSWRREYYDNSSDSTTKSPTMKNYDAKGTKNADRIKTLKKDPYILGNKDATITIIEYTDPECPYCIMQYQNRVLKDLISYYSGSVNMITKPVQWVNHSGTEYKSLAMLCAGNLGGQKAYYGMYEKIYANSNSQKVVPTSAIVDYAKELNLSLDNFNNCVESKSFQLSYNANWDEFATFALASNRWTPGSVIINTETGEWRLLLGAQPIDAFKKQIFDLKLAE